jgi:hypothetical protein
MCFQEGLHLANPACGKRRRAVPEVWSSLLGGFELTGPNGVVDLPSKKLAGLLADQLPRR